MHGWIDKTILMQYVKSNALRGWLLQTYNKGVPCNVQLRSFKVSNPLILIELRCPAGKCGLSVPASAVDIEVKMRGRSVPLSVFVDNRRYFVATVQRKGTKGRAS